MNLTSGGDSLAALERLGARRVGRRRIPALLADLGPLEPQAWQRLDDILSAFDRDLLAGAIGAGAAELEAVRRERGAGSVTTGPVDDGSGSAGAS